MTDTAYEDLHYEVVRRVAIITFDRPDEMNAARGQTHAELVRALDEADRDDGVRAVIVTGKGRAFCAGTDISAGFRLPTEGDPATGEGVKPDVGGQTVLRIFEMRKPVIAAINGAAIGFGATVTLAMDFRLVSEDARFGFVFSRRGIVAESCSSWFLPRLVGITTALDWMMTGRMIGAEEAVRKGLASEALRSEDLMTRAMAIATDIAENTSPVSVAVNRRLLWRMLGAEDPAIAHRLESRGLAATLRMPDAIEGVAAFKEKRPPNFTTRVDAADFVLNWWPALRDRSVS